MYKMDGRKVNRGLVGFQKDLQRLNSNFGRLTSKNLKLISRNVSKAYAKRYNDIMRGEGHNSLAKAHVSSRRSTSTQISVNVVVPKKSVDYDIAFPHHVDANRPSIRSWIRKVWNFSGGKWRPTKRFSFLSKVHTTKRGAPSGTLFVMSHVYKYGWSVADKSNDVVLATLSSELNEFVNKRFKSDVRNFLKSNYEETFNFRISAKAR